jgi:hypothetical protein
MASDKRIWKKIIVTRSQNASRSEAIAAVASDLFEPCTNSYSHTVETFTIPFTFFTYKFF